MIEYRSVFYYGNVVEETSNTLRVNEGTGDIDVAISNGRYSLSNYLQAVTDALNTSLVNEYTITLDRDTRLVTINGSGVFSLKVLDIFPLNSGFPVLGFNDLVNLSGASSYTSDSASGMVYYPQYFTQDYVPFSRNKEYIDGTIKESPSGVIEVVSFGLKEKMELDIKFATDYEMTQGAPIENNPNGVANLESFLDYCISKGEMEFMLDRNDRDAFETIFLESTKDNRDGLGYTLRDAELYGFFNTGKLTFRKA